MSHGEKSLHTRTTSSSIHTVPVGYYLYFTSRRVAGKFQDSSNNLQYLS
jgi:hypothetical protein